MREHSRVSLIERDAVAVFEAVETSVAENENFEIDRSRESFLITWNPGGFLKRQRA